jgi:hypothetical protein
MTTTSAAERAARERTEQGLPEHVENSAVLALVAGLMEDEAALDNAEGAA